MRLFGLEITRTRTKAANTLASVSSRGGWWPIIREPFAGAWQQNIEVRRDDVLAYAPVFACISLIAGDIAKLPLRLMERVGSTWRVTDSPAFSPVLRRPNHFQNRIRFIETWMISKLTWGNAYLLKQRDQRGVVVALYVLDPTRVTPLVAPDGSVFYQLQRDDLAAIPPSADSAAPAVPAREIIHDLMNPIYHPLVGVSPIFACGLAATQGLKIQNNSTRFFQNGSQPGGILTAPGEITDDTALRLKTHWEANYAGQNVGKIAVLGDGLKYEALAVNAVDSQLIEQLKWTAETVCSVFHVPAYMVGVGPVPTYNNIEALNQQYYAQCLQSLIESIELCLDEGLAMPPIYGTEFDLNALLRMDTAARYKAHSDAIGGGWLSPNEAREREDLPPVEGGESPYMQEQNWPLRHLSKRELPDRQPTPPAQSSQEPEPEPTDNDIKAQSMLAAIILEKELPYA